MVGRIILTLVVFTLFLSLGCLKPTTPLTNNDQNENIGIANNSTQDILVNDSEKQNNTKKELCDFDSVLQKDACLFDYAKKSENASVCELIYSENKADECYDYLARIKNNSTLCFNIHEKELFNSCILKFALETKNIDLCYKLKNESMKIECKNIVMPPCKAYENQTYEWQYCMAREYKDAKYCEEQKCFFEIAKLLQKPEICNNSKVGSGGDPIACKSYVDNRNYCMDIELQAQRDECYLLLATYENASQYCAKITPETMYSEKCYTNISIIRKNPGYCAYLSDFEQKRQCKYDYSINTGDKKGCDLIDKLSPITKDKCYFDVAQSTLKPSVCNSIEQIDKKKICWMLIFRNESFVDEKECEAIPLVEWKDDCFEKIAYNLQDISLCEKIQNPNSKTNCKNKIIILNP